MHACGEISATVLLRPYCMLHVSFKVKYPVMLTASNVHLIWKMYIFVHIVVKKFFFYFVTQNFYLFINLCFSMVQIILRYH